MASQAGPVETLKASIEAARVALGEGELAAAHLDALGNGELIDVAQQLERLARRVEAAQRHVTAAAQRSGEFRADGHRNTSAWLRATTRCSRAESVARSRSAALLEHLPQLAAAVADDRVPSAHLRSVAATFANPRVIDALVAADEWVTEHAVTLDHDLFRQMLERWEQLADFDGAHQRADEAHHGRMAQLSRVGDEYHLRARCGITQGKLLEEILAHFADAEYQFDVDQARQTITERPVGRDDLARTARQRRFDALLAIFEAGASAPVDGRVPNIDVHVVADLATVEAALAAVTTGHLDSSRVDPAAGRCEFLDGTPLPWTDLATAALLGRLRRVVFDNAGVVIDLGRAGSLFSGSARRAALLQGLRCRWPGCGQTHHTQVDHRDPRSNGGPTTQVNADILCGHHNRWKHRGYAVRRDPSGRWHVHRLDGTQITAA